MNLNRKIDILKVDRELKKILDDARHERVIRGLDKDKQSYPRVTKMMMNCPSFNTVVKELKTLPKKEDLEKFRRGIW